MTDGDTLSVIVPALDEAPNLRATVDEIVRAVEGDLQDYEILIVDDCSTDGTGAIADALAAENPHVRVVHNPEHAGLGRNFRRGLELARMTYVTLVNGKHDLAAEELRKILALRGRADVIVPYAVNSHERSFFRRTVSRTFTGLLNLLFGYRLHYYNDSVLHRRAELLTLVLRTDSYAYTAEALIKALRCGRTYLEVPIACLFPPGIKTNAFRWRNVSGVARFLVSIVYDIYIGRNYRRA